MPLSEILVRNFKGIRFIRLQFGKRTIISGMNGSGKSSITDAITAAFEGGFDASLVRDPDAEGAGDITIGEPPAEKKPTPETKAIIEVHFTDGSYAKRVIDKARNTSSVEAFSKEGERLGGQGYIEELATAMTLNPIRFLVAGTEERAKILMQFLVVPLSPEELDFIPDGRWWLDKALDHKGKFLPCFDALNKVEKACVERRREINRRVDECAKTVNNLRGRMETLNDSSEDWAGKASIAAAEYREIVADHRAALLDITTQAEAAELRARELRASADRETDSWLNAEIQKLKAEAEKRKRESADTMQSTLETISRVRKESEAEVDEQYREPLKKAEAASIEANHLLKQYNETQGIRVHIAETEKSWKEHQSLSTKFDFAIAKIRKLREEKMEEVPIPGLAMKEGEVYYRDLSLDTINTAQQIEVATQLCTQASGREKILILDEAEHLDSVTREDFYSALVRAGFQVIAAEVTDGPLKVVTL